MTEVHDLVYHGHGGFPYDQVYNMPIKYRKFHIQKINEYLEKKAENEQKSIEESKKPTSNKNIHRPNISQADYTSKIKAPKK
jgi:hypothetical protein